MNGKAIRGVAAWVGGAAVIAAVVAWFTAGRPEPLPHLYPMPSFELTTEQGTTLRAADLEGKVVVANFIFTTCPTVCPMLTAHMAKLQDRLASRPDVRLLSFSVDPRNDTPEVLKAYGERFGQDPARWTFLTGGIDAITEAVERGFKIGMQGADDPDATAFDIVHGEHFVLVDAAGSIRGYYRPDPESLERLAADAERLAAEAGG
ncbi:MAG TPA: SCO family protein [Vulgatibacter sp.]|nr:SCO family protein [Vulgatibacter sp.]